MAHHNSTPKSVLSAPVSQPVTISEQKGFSRRERRQGSYFPPGMDSAAKTAAHTEAMAAGKNVPFVKPVQS